MMVTISEYRRPVSDNSKSVQLQLAPEDSQKNGQIHPGKHGGRKLQRKENEGISSSVKDNNQEELVTHPQRNTT